MSYGAYGLVEVLGDANAVLVTDRMLKAADVEYVTKDSAVTAAVESVKENPPCRIFQSAVISNPSQEMVDIVEMFRNR